MLKKRAAAVLALLAILLPISACSDEAPEDKQSANHTPADQSDNRDKPEPDRQQIQLPQDQLKKTDANDKVTALQEVFNNIGYDIELTGTYDDVTTWAVTDYQLQKDLPVTGIYNDATRNTLKKSLDSDAAIDPGTGLEKPDDNAAVIDNPHDILVLINKEHRLPDGFTPLNLTVPDVRFPFDESLPKKQMRQVAATALEDMFEAANNADLELFAQSGYRSYGRQDAIFAANVQEHGEEAANNFSARPGESEHQSGLTMDVTSPDVNFKLIKAFGKTDEGKWLKQHAAEYGFIIRYPKGKQSITKYQYEPWHLRYVGKQAAADITEQGITLEEYTGTD